MTRCKLGDHISIKHGFAFDGEFFSEDDNGVVLVTPGNFAIGGGYQEGKGKYFIGEYPKEYVLEPNALIVTMTDLSKGIDTLGYGALVPDDGRTYLHNQRIGLVEFKDDAIDKVWLSYLMRSRDYQRTIAGSSSGSTVHHTSPAKICSYEFDLPDKRVQKKIADVLLTYDKLIENNRKQIALLEEAAQRLYKEWFVDLRFPGYQSVELVNGLPNGWKKTELGVLSSFRRGKTIKKSETEGGPIPVIAGGLTPACYHSAANTVEPVVTISGSGANAGFTQIHLENVWASDCSYIDSTVTNYIFFAYLSAKVLGGGFKQMQRGSAQPHVYPKDVNALNIVLPDETTLSAFEEFASAIYSKIRLLRQSNTDASEARNRLLPKLMSGEIEV